MFLKLQQLLSYNKSTAESQ